MEGYISSTSRGDYDGKYLTQNYAIYGNPCIAKGEVSNFTASNYLMLPNLFSPNNNNWEIVLKFTTSTDITSVGALLETYNVSSTNSTSLSIYQRNGTLETYLSSNSTSWNLASEKTIITINTNTTYWVKAVYDGTKYSYYISLDGINYDLKTTVETNTPIVSGYNLRIGVNRGGTYFKGKIDLKESYININNSPWWDCWM